MSSATFRILLGNMSLRCPPELLLRQAIRFVFPAIDTQACRRVYCNRAMSAWQIRVSHLKCLSLSTIIMTIILDKLTHKRVVESTVTELCRLGKSRVSHLKCLSLSTIIVTIILDKYL